MTSFSEVLRENRNYRYLWMGQVVSETGAHFNSIAVLSLALHLTGSSVPVGLVMMARTVCAIAASPIAGVLLDRMDRKRVMIASDAARAVIAFSFISVIWYRQEWLLYLLSGLLTFASPFFTSGRSAILPRITTPDELHTANALTQTTQWLTLAIGTMLGGVSAMQFGYEWAFVANGLSFVFSVFAISKLRAPDDGRGFLPVPKDVLVERHFWREYRESLAYMWRTPLVLAIGFAGVGWASGGGAAQILFTLFGELVFKGGPAGVGLIWGFAGIGLVIGGVLGHRMGRGLTYRRYLHIVWIGFLVHGGGYLLFAAGNLWNAIFWIAISRVAMGMNNVLNRSMLLHHVPDHLRGRVFTTVQAMSDAVMMVSLGAASVATQYYSVRSIGMVAGAVSASTALFWAWAVWAGRLPEPRRVIVVDEDVGEGESAPAA